MFCQILAAAGVAVGVVVGRVSKKDSARKVVKSAIRGGLAAGKAVQTAFGGIREQFTDLAAEAKAEMVQPPVRAAEPAPKPPVAGPATTGTPTPPKAPPSPVI
jgi:hypothetical protein